MHVASRTLDPPCPDGPHLREQVGCEPSVRSWGVHRRSLALAGMLTSLSLTGLACDRGRDHVAIFPRAGGEGAVETCPAVRANVDARGVAGPDTTRCSYHDALGGLVVEVSGSVRGETEGGTTLGPAFAELEVSLHREDGVAFSPRAEGRARTDTQGHFHLSTLVEQPGAYVLVVRSPGGTAPLARHRLLVEKGGRTRLSGLAIIVPLDRDLSGPP